MSLNTLTLLVRKNMECMCILVVQKCCIASEIIEEISRFSCSSMVRAFQDNKLILLLSFRWNHWFFLHCQTTTNTCGCLKRIHFRRTQSYPREKPRCVIPLHISTMCVQRIYKKVLLADTPHYKMFIVKMVLLRLNLQIEKGID